LFCFIWFDHNNCTTIFLEKICQIIAFSIDEFQSKTTNCNSVIDFFFVFFGFVVLLNLTKGTNIKRGEGRGLLRKEKKKREKRKKQDFVVIV